MLILFSFLSYIRATVYSVSYLLKDNKGRFELDASSRHLASSGFIRVYEHLGALRF